MYDTAKWEMYNGYQGEMKQRLKGASLVEALVASVIFLTVFFIAMDSLMNISRVSLPVVSPVDIEMSVNECVKKFAEGMDSKASFSYTWGNIEIDSIPYKAADCVLDVTVSAKDKNGCLVIYRLLICQDSTRN